MEQDRDEMDTGAHVPNDELEAAGVQDFDNETNPEDEQTDFTGNEVKRGAVIYRDMKVPLGSEEQLQLSGELVECLDEIAATRELRRSQTKGANAAIKDLEAKRDRIKRECSEAAHTVQTECVWETDYTINEKRLIRLDTDEIVERRTLTATELQEEMDLSPDNDGNGEEFEPWVDPESLADEGPEADVQGILDDAEPDEDDDDDELEDDAA